MDLDITNYDYDDILKLFAIGKHFNEEDLKSAKKRVLASHPDKSGLDKSYFLFFSSAYKILFNIYNFREKHSSLTNLNNYNENYEADKDEVNEELIHKIMTTKSTQEFNKWFNEQFDTMKIANDYEENEELIHKIMTTKSTQEFNKWFNEQFDTMKIANDYEENGYGDWLNSSNNEETVKCTDINSIHKIMEEKKKVLRSNNLIKKKDISEFNNTNYCELTNSKPEDYSSGLFSKFQYEDLKKAHEESIIPVTNEDNISNYTSLDDIKFKRTQQSIVPMKNDEANKYLNKTKEDENDISCMRAYNLYKQDEINKKNNDKFWSNLKQLL